MEFKETQPIYLQIADFVCEKIISKTWSVEQRIPAVRELAVLLEVNPNTVMRTYEFLQQKDILYNQRGVGLFVSPGGPKNALEYRRSEFMQKEMPSFFKSLQLLQMDLDDLEPLYKKYKKQNA
ncbi:GntR family transcriptional regulator [Chryseolinea soli]|uniref:GntR family transcriptional regulator n=1 Tax=Chryseolinea soli TaxID=2321403 RepID=A0A385SWI3_9BACT|nr:GntR family transcriptional regulator [Chryseolinea soli]AYB34641.1 GntR family transcriptional regulator [Chryseolinea soli]